MNPNQQQIDLLTIRANQEKAKAQYQWQENNTQQALAHEAEHTRIKTYINVLKGGAEHMRVCIEHHKANPKQVSLTRTHNPPPPSFRRYKLEDHGGLKGNCDFLTRQAHQRIAQRQLDKPYRKPMPMPVLKLE